ncbi:MAG TPA: AbrB/MazE/SpoVT family DNA-binding domain-containing protein [Acidimicrobiia bacterium]|nr:AbrB/MazE/SpoVT family DNA-binding domain-containing protein [Acidimicrobiia bacterium]
MSEIASARRVDQLGRIVVPAELRRALNIEAGDVIDFHVADNRIVLRKVETACVICGSTKNLAPLHEKLICAQCVDDIRNEPECASCGRLDALVKVGARYFCARCIDDIALAKPDVVDLTRPDGAADGHRPAKAKR